MNAHLKYDATDHTFSFDRDSSGFFNVALQITRNCNLRCLHCCESSKIKEPSTKEIFRIIDNISSSGVERVCLTGGEPTIRKDFMQIIEYMKSKDMIITLSTNAFALNKETLQRLKGKIANLRISIYGDEKTHDSITGVKNSFKKVGQNTRLAREIGIPVYLCMTVMKKNLDQIEIVSKICRKWKIKKLILFSMMDKGRGKLVYEEQQVHDYEIMKHIKKNKHKIPSIYWTPLITDGICAIIHPDGDLIATPYKKNPSNVRVIGNVLNDSLTSLWKKYPFKENYLSYYEKKGKKK